MATRYQIHSFIFIKCVERVVRVLEDIGELENTFIFYTSDHGYHLGRHIFLLYQYSVHVFTKNQGHFFLQLLVTVVFTSSPSHTAEAPHRECCVQRSFKREKLKNV